MLDAPEVTSPAELWRYRLAPATLLTAAALTLFYVVVVVDRHTIALVQSRHLLPRWDLATHLGHGWVDYNYLAAGQIPRLLWDFWLQGYWPPALSIFQVPFYLLLGGSITSGLRSSLAAFVLTGLLGCAVLWRLWRLGALLPAGIFLALLTSSPFLLAYASVTMTEMLGAAVQLAVLWSYVRYRQQPNPQTARSFAISLTVLFFTKYNYFFLLVAPLVVCEWVEWTAGWSLTRRARAIRRSTVRLLSSPAAAFVALYAAALLLIIRTGGFDVHVFGRRVSVHTIGNTGQIVLFVLLARLWYLNRRGRIEWARLTSADLRIRPLLLWFGVPVAIWFASPYPNHIRDFANLVVNRPLGASSVESGVASYVTALRVQYFYSDWVLAFVVVTFAIAAGHYKKQPPVMRWLVIAVPLQSAAIALHQTRFPRFLLLTVVLLCLAASSEIGRWIAGGRRGPLLPGLFAAAVLACGIGAARNVVIEERFQAVAFEHYTDSEPLRRALQEIRFELKPDDRLAIVGQSNEISPGLLRWELGPPSGVACEPFEIGGAKRLDLGLATRVLLMESDGPGSPTLDMTSYYHPQRRAVLERVQQGEFVPLREVVLPDLHVRLREYRRTSPPPRVADCEGWL
jgi:hypothetical protein